MAKENVTYTHTEILLAIRKKEILPFIITWMDLEGIILSGMSQAEKDKYCVSLSCESKKK